MKKKSPLISAADLVKKISNENLVLIDARTGPDAREKYNAAHLSGAVFANMEIDLAKKAPDASVGGRHPLPPIKDFCEWLGKIGVDPTKHVVIYDEKNGANAAARCWWMLRALGHENVQVLDGGLKAAIEAGLSLTDKLTNVKPLPTYPAEKWMLPIVDMDTVAKAVADPGAKVNRLIPLLVIYPGLLIFRI
jgi:thiosulfate/3-mercaptopyruvate sulfurtransferase